MMNEQHAWQLLENSLRAQQDMARYDVRLSDPHGVLKSLYCSLKARGIEPDAAFKALLAEKSPLLPMPAPGEQ